MGNNKILLVTQLYPPESGGNASRISDMADGLKNLGADISILSPVPTFPFGSFKRTWRPWVRKSEREIDVTNLWTWQPSSVDPGFASRITYYLVYAVHAAIWALVHKGNYDIIVTSVPPLFVNLAGLLPGLVFGKKWVIDVRDLWIDASISLGFIKKDSIMEKLSRLFEQLCYTRTDLICVTTEETKKKILARYDHLQPEKIVVVPNGVDISRFYPQGEKKPAQLIYTGNVGYAQDLETAVLAMGTVGRTHRALLLIVGEGDMKERLKSLVQEKGLGNYVIFKDLVPREEIPRLISESYLGLAPLKDIESLEYAIPSKVYEYMACGIPFVGCGKGEIVNIAVRSKAGIITDNVPESIADAIGKLLDDPGKVAGMGRGGREYVTQYCERKAIARKFYEYIVEAGARHSMEARTDGSGCTLNNYTSR
ncbi:putative glycosyltransferase [Methanocella paludicola SANAE]|uniref:Glycosyltransferase n=1 Tax=Methanocella paludicola (strain DSM 17711 / JCM 13418 / NBRC 101707 / SANAE) TaxID=304371 RepID=D1Z1N6_METPS|nr:putative glycosyltransferase [Methanocella paludicola SANAE]